MSCRGAPHCSVVAALRLLSGDRIRGYLGGLCGLTRRASGKLQHKQSGKRTMQLGKYFGATVMCLLAVTAVARAGTLEDIRARGTVRCGLVPANPGFAAPDNQGVLNGFDVDFCHAIAAAVLGDDSKILAAPVQPRDALTVLATGGTDVLTHRLTWTFNRDNGTGVEFTAINFYDGQGFIVRKSLGVKSLKELSGASICVTQGTTTELNVADYFKSHDMTYKIVTFNELDAAIRAYDEGRCDAYTNDRSALASRRTGLKAPGDHDILPETISKEPISPLVRQNDAQWAHIVKWTIFATITAEELCLTQANVDEQKATATNPEVKRLLGVGDDLGQKLGLSADWAYRIVKQVGNYAEIFNRNVGNASPIKLTRGANVLWRDGGMIYAPPFR